MGIRSGVGYHGGIVHNVVAAFYLFVCLFVCVFSYLCFAKDYTKLKLKLKQQSQHHYYKVLLDFVTHELSCSTPSSSSD